MAYGKKRGMRSKRTYRRKRSVKGSKSLTKTEKSQVKTIAKKVVNNIAETKYFATSAAVNKIIPTPLWYTASGVSEISCMGFTTGKAQASATSPAPRVGFNYGVNLLTGAEIPMTSLDMNKIFTNFDVVESRRQQQLIGNSCRPSYAECQWYLERPQTDVTQSPLPGSVIQVRMIRVRARTRKGANQPINPKLDLFLDQYNEPFGIQTTTSGGSPIFGNYEFQMAKVNSRRYQCIEDKIFQMTPSSITNDFAGAPSYNQVNYASYGGTRKIKTKHNIGKELYYDTPNANTSPTNNYDQYPETGFEPEFILWHFQTVGQPVSVSQRVNTDNINMTARPVSTFKDI